MTATLRATPLAPIPTLAFLVAGFILLPLLYVLFLAVTADPTVWARLLGTRIPELLSNTVALAVSSALGTFVFGVPLAWIVTRLEFPGRRIWEWALVLPLAIPSYVLAYIYTYLLGMGGPVEQAWRVLAGPEAQVFSPFSFAGATLVMTFNNFPFVYLLTRAALLNFNVSFEEVARASGASRLRTWTRITLPMVRPAIVAGLSLVILYVISDFGAVSLLRYQTLTYAVYQQITSRYDPSAASVLSVLLVAFALLFLVGERWFRQRSRYYQTGGRFRSPQRRTCRPVEALAVTGYLLLVFGAAFGLPALLLGRWSMGAVEEGAIDARFLGFMWNSAFLSGAAATGAVLLGTPLAYLASRSRSRFGQLWVQTAYVGYVLPGPVAALALLALFSDFAPFLYGGVLVLIVAYIVHFLPAGLQSMEPALQQVTPNLEEVSRTLGYSLGASLRKVTLPLVRSGFVVAWVLMFLQAVKELPATLLLRPVGYDTLAVRVWLEASEELYQLAAPSALLIVVVTLPALLLLVARDWRAA